MIQAPPAAGSRRAPRRPGLRLALAGLAGLSAIACVSTFVSTRAFTAFGAAPSGAALLRILGSPQFRDGHFENQEPTSVMKEGAWAGYWHWLTGDEMRVPSCPLPLASDTSKRLGATPGSGLRITWLGHSTTLLEVDGSVILTDPIWSERASPSGWVGPKRFHPPPLAISELPRVDAVVISHEHYDHLDMHTVQALSQRGLAFHVPLGMGSHLRSWGVPEAQVQEHDWWQRARLSTGLELVSTPARHFNGRGVPGRIGALWTSWSLIGPKHRVFFSGDTGESDGFREVAQREGPFDAALLEIGQHHPSWGDIHLGPHGALAVHAMLGAKYLVPIHWGTFQLGMHDWSEPAETLTRQAAARQAVLVTPLLGEAVEPSLGQLGSAWWRGLPPTTTVCP